MFKFSCCHCGKVYSSKSPSDKEVRAFVRKHLMNLCTPAGETSYKWYLFFRQEDNP